MTSLDHTTFREREIDALYDELDPTTAAAMREHAASCEACASRLGRLRRGRSTVAEALTESVAPDFESRIMAAVDAALASQDSRGAQGAHASRAVSAVPAAPAEDDADGGGGARIFRFLSRPAFLVAASFALVLGGAAFMQTSRKSDSRPMDSPAPMIAAPGAALSPAPQEEPAERAAPAAVAATAAVAEAPTAEPEANEAPAKPAIKLGEAAASAVAMHAAKAQADAGPKAASVAVVPAAAAPNAGGASVGGKASPKAPLRTEPVYPSAPSKR